MIVLPHVESILTTIAILYVYFFPTIFAKIVKHVGVEVIFFLNLVTGWTIVGWFATLLWAFDRRKEG